MITLQGDEKFVDNTFGCFDTILQCERQTEEHTDILRQHI